jgi:hypothetical protein
MYFCENCGATKGTPTKGCLAFFSRGPHSYVYGNSEMSCVYCDSRPGGIGIRCPGRMEGGCHDFRAVVVTASKVHTKTV